jgi:hypothetical protein
LGEHAIEGFASCAVCMHPELFHPESGQANSRDSAENAWPRTSRQDRGGLS